MMKLISISAYFYANKKLEKKISIKKPLYTSVYNIE